MLLHVFDVRFVDPTIKTIGMSSLFHEQFSSIIRLRMIFAEALEEITLVGLTILDIHLFRGL
jgi:hypothetical protein